MVNRDFSFVACFFVRLKRLWWFFFFFICIVIWQAELASWGPFTEAHTAYLPLAQTCTRTSAFHVPNTCICMSTSVKALSVMVKPNWKGWLACNVLTAYCCLHRGLGGHLTFSCSAHVSRAWRGGETLLLSALEWKGCQCVTEYGKFPPTVALSMFLFFSFLILHPFRGKKKLYQMWCS